MIKVFSCFVDAKEVVQSLLASCLIVILTLAVPAQTLAAYRLPPRGLRLLGWSCGARILLPPCWNGRDSMI